MIRATIKTTVAALLLAAALCLALFGFEDARLLAQHLTGRELLVPHRLQSWLVPGCLIVGAYCFVGVWMRSLSARVTVGMATAAPVCWVLWQFAQVRVFA